MKKLPLSFYTRPDVVQIAQDLLGKVVVTSIDGQPCAGRIAETEAYIAFTDRASHSYGGKRTARNEAMYAPGGTAYVYICYGLHRMLNVVTNKSGVPDAVLIRAVEPLEGIAVMLQRTGRAALSPLLTRGPGNLAKAMGIDKAHSGLSLRDDLIFIANDGFAVMPSMIGVSRRIGIDGAGEDALLPYRFYLRGNPYVSARPTQ